MAPPPSLAPLAARLAGVRAGARAPEGADAERHDHVMDEFRALRAAGEARGERMLEAMQAQSRLVIQAGGVIVALLIVGLLGVVGVGLDLDVPGIGRVGIAEASEPVTVLDHP